MRIDFCPELQIPWSIEDVSIQGLAEIKVVLVEYSQEEYPESVGRHGKDVLTWPTIFNERKRAEFSFSRCVYFNIRDEFSPGAAENDMGEGKQFQRLLESELLSSHRERAMDNLVHYRIIGINEIIDILSHESPHIIKKNFA